MDKQYSLHVRSFTPHLEMSSAHIIPALDIHEHTVKSKENRDNIKKTKGLILFACSLLLSETNELYVLSSGNSRIPQCTFTYPPCHI